MLAVKVNTFRQAMSGTSLKQTSTSGRKAMNTTTRAATKVASTQKLKAAPKSTPKPAAPKPAPKTVVRKAGTVKLSNGTKAVKNGTVKIGTQSKKVSAIPMFEPSDKSFRPKQVSNKPAPKILARVEQLKLLSKLEQAGLLSAIEKSGLTLSAIEKSGLLSKAESLGLISAAADRNTPSALYTLATLLLLAGPALVYFTPDDGIALVAVQAVGALACILGGAAAYGGASLLSNLQK